VASQTFNKPVPEPAVAPKQRSELSAPARVKTESPKPKQTLPPARSATPPQSVAQEAVTPAPQAASSTPKQVARPGNVAPVTSNTAINGWDPNPAENKPVAPQQTEPRQATPPDGKTVDFLPPKVLLEVMPNIRNLSSNLVTEVTRVEVEVRIDTNGRVNAAHLATPNVKSQLASAALAAARQWTFQPATLRGQRVETTHTIAFEFRPGGQ
jgi:TonB family protein